jgi:hypothetical protein
MPIHYRIDPALGVVFQEWSGVVGPTELLAHWQQVLDDPEATRCRRVLSDLGHVQLALDREDVTEAFRQALAPRMGSDWLLAIVVTEVKQLRLAHHFQGLASWLSRDAVFSNREQALAWLLSQ